MKESVDEMIKYLVLLFFALVLSNCTVVLLEDPLYSSHVQTPYNSYYVPSGQSCSVVYGYADLYRSGNFTIRDGQSRIQC